MAGYTGNLGIAQLYSRSDYNIRSPLMLTSLLEQEIIERCLFSFLFHFSICLILYLVIFLNFIFILFIFYKTEKGSSLVLFRVLFSIVPLIVLLC